MQLHIFNDQEQAVLALFYELEEFCHAHLWASLQSHDCNSDECKRTWKEYVETKAGFLARLPKKDYVASKTALDRWEVHIHQTCDCLRHARADQRRIDTPNTKRADVVRYIKSRDDGYRAAQECQAMTIEQRTILIQLLNRQEN